MATYAQLSQDFWTDNYILDLETPAKLLFVYLLTNSHRNTTGIYEIHLRTVAYETGLELTAIKECLSDFAHAGKVFYEEGHIILANRPLHTSFNNENVRNFVVKHVNSLPASIQENHPDLLSALLNLAIGNVETGVDQPLGQGVSVLYTNSKVKKRKEKKNKVKKSENETDHSAEAEANKIVEVNGVLMRNREVDDLVELMGGDDAAYQRITKKVRAYYDKKNTDPDDGYKACVTFWKNEQKWKLEESDGKHPNRKKSAK